MGASDMAQQPTGRDPVARAMLVLAGMVDGKRRDWGVRELAAALEMPPTTVHRAMSSLAGAGIVRESGGRYRIGEELHRMARRLLADNTFDRLAHDHLRTLVSASGESAMLAVFDEPGRRYSLVQVVESNQPLKYVQTLNQWVPVHVGAAGIAILSSLPPDVRAELLREADLIAWTPDTPKTIDEVEAECWQVSAQGYAITRGQKLPGAVGIAVAVFAYQDGKERVLGSVSLTIPGQRCTAELEESLPPMVKKCAARISADLGASTRGSRP